MKLLDAISGITYPEKSVIIFPDFEAMNRIGELGLEAAALSEKDADLNNELLAEQEALQKQVWDTRWVFTLRGLPRSIVEVVGKKHLRMKDVQERIGAVNEELVLRSVAKVVNAADEEMEFDDEALAEFFKVIPQDAYFKFVEAVNELSGDSLKYESQVLDPNFL